MKRAQFNTLVGGSLLSASANACSHAPAEAPVALPPIRSFPDARMEIERTIAADIADPTISLAGRPRLYDHGKPTARAILLLHGFTNCPQQFDEIARDFFARGCNVYVPRIPHHGKRDRMTHDLASSSVAEMTAFADRAFQLASALGSHVTVAGLSLGGTLAMWLAQTKAVDLVLPISPFLTPSGYSRSSAAALMRIAQAIPDIYWWWDIRKRENTTPIYAYPGYPIHALAQIMFLGSSIFEAAGRTRPLARRCILVSNVDDNGINNAVSAELLALWQNHGARYAEFFFHKLGEPRHDIIDPTTFPAARTLVYPQLQALALS